MQSGFPLTIYNIPEVCAVTFSGMCRLYRKSLITGSVTEVPTRAHFMDLALHKNREALEHDPAVTRTIGTSWKFMKHRAGVFF